MAFLKSIFDLLAATEAVWLLVNCIHSGLCRAANTLRLTPSRPLPLTASCDWFLPLVSASAEGQRLFTGRVAVAQVSG